MSLEDFGTEQTTDEDRAYSGSRFSEVRDALFNNSYQRVWGEDGEPALPVSKVTLGSVLRYWSPVSENPGNSVDSWSKLKLPDSIL